MNGANPLPSLADAELGLYYGRTQSYMSMLMKLNSTLSEEILFDWRDCPKRVGVVEMLQVAKLPEGERLDAYSKLKAMND